MKVTSKLVAGIVLCAGFVQIATSKTVTMKVAKEDPEMELFYGVETLDKPDRVDYQQLTKDSIKFDVDKAGKLYFNMSEEGQGRSLSVMKNKVGRGDSEEVIIINRAGMPRYGTMKEVKFFKEQSKTKQKKQRG